MAGPTVNLPQLQQTGYTLEDWASWEGRWELVDGVAYDMTPSPNRRHQEFSGSLFLALGQALSGGRRKGPGGGCRVYAAPMDVFLGLNVVNPDLLVVCDETKLSDRGIEGPPDLVVEILSPSTMGKDLTTKRWLYERAGVPEYLIVHPAEARAELMRLDGRGVYQTVHRAELGQQLPLLGGTLVVPFDGAAIGE
jgi:Uma2 family endonuclease